MAELYNLDSTQRYDTLPSIKKQPHHDGVLLASYCLAADRRNLGSNTYLVQNIFTQI